MLHSIWGYDTTKNILYDYITEIRQKSNKLFKQQQQQLNVDLVGSSRASCPMKLPL